MPSIQTLIPDIYHLIGKDESWMSDTLAESFSQRLGNRLQIETSPKEHRGLRLSQLGPWCPRALWYSVNKPEEADKFKPWTKIQFTYGHIVEAYALTMAEAAGHTVTGEQDAVECDGILGHRDAVIDGCLVDVKSAGRYMLEKFKSKAIETDDLFGYLDQLDGYLVGSEQDPLLLRKDVAYDWLVDKQLGHMFLYEHHVRHSHIKDRIKTYKGIVGQAAPPPCQCVTEPQGKSGNIKLGVRASYSMFKHCCFPNLRTFIYSDGPTYLTKVIKKPDVMEVDRYGNQV